MFVPMRTEFYLRRFKTNEGITFGTSNCFVKHTFFKDRLFMKLMIDIMDIFSTLCLCTNKTTKQHKCKGLMADV